MIDSIKLSQFAEELSNTPCPVCGKCHKVWFEVERTEFWDFIKTSHENGTCDGFKEFVKERLKSSQIRLSRPLW